MVSDMFTVRLKAVCSGYIWKHVFTELLLGWSQKRNLFITPHQPTTRSPSKQVALDRPGLGSSPLFPTVRTTSDEAMTPDVTFLWKNKWPGTKNNCPAARARTLARATLWRKSKYCVIVLVCSQTPALSQYILLWFYCSRSAAVIFLATGLITTHPRASLCTTLTEEFTFNLFFICVLLERNTDCKRIFSPVPPLLEYPGCLPLRLRPHPQPHGQPDSCGSRNHIRQPFCPSYCCGCQQQSGTYHRLPGRLQRELTQGNMAHRVSGHAQTGCAWILVLRKSILCQLWCSAQIVVERSFVLVILSSNPEP